MTRRNACLALTLTLALLAPAVAHAQLSHRTPTVPAAVPEKTLKTRLGIDVADALLKSQAPEERQRGFERLSSVGTAQALDLLLKVFDSGGAARSARDRLVAVRALAPHAATPAVRELLVRIMVGVGSNPERAEAIDGLIEHAAALALARSGDGAALAALGKALHQPGHVADTAGDALSAFPPRNLQTIVQSKSAPTQALVSLLLALGDPRAVPALRVIVQSAPPDVRAGAAVALSKFGDLETLELARLWLTRETSPELRLSSARILVQLGAPDAASAVRTLLSEPQTRGAALQLAGTVSLPALTPTLVRLATNAEGEERAAIFAALGLCGTRDAFSFLELALRAQETSSPAALALALAPNREAEAALSRALGTAGTRRVAVRASIARLVSLGPEHAVAGLEAALTELSRSRDPTDLAVFAQASAALWPAQVPALLRRASATQVRALGRAALASKAAEALAERLALEPDPELKTALAACLASPTAAELVPTDVLLTLLDARGLSAPLAARALAARDSPTLRPKILSALGSDDAILRSHVALGLGQSEESSALGVLERAYRFETSDDVRLSIVRALAARPEPTRWRTLDLARTLDGSRAVRSAAALALALGRPASGPGGSQSVWLDFSVAGGSSRVEASAGIAAALLTTSGGLGVPAFADPDGVLLLPALPTGPVSVRLAAPTRTDDASRPNPP